MEDFDVYLKLYGEIVQVEGRDYALIRKLSAFSENPLFPEMLCVNVRPVKMVPLEIWEKVKSVRASVKCRDVTKCGKQQNPSCKSFLTQRILVEIRHGCGECWLWCLFSKSGIKGRINFWLLQKS